MPEPRSTDANKGGFVGVGKVAFLVALAAVVGALLANLHVGLSVRTRVDTLHHMSSVASDLMCKVTGTTVSAASAAAKCLYDLQKSGLLPSRDTKLLKSTYVVPEHRPLGEPWVRNGVQRGGAEWILPHAVKSSQERVLYIHGNGTTGLDQTRAFASRLANATMMPVLTVDYRLPPETGLREQIEDVIEAIQFTWTHGPHRRHEAQEVYVVGMSMGGTLVLAALHAIIAGEIDHETPLPMAVKLPTAAVTFSAIADLSCPHETENDVDWCKNAIISHFGRQPHGVKSPSHAPEEWLKRLPPLLMLVGGEEALVDETESYAKRARKGGAIYAKHHVVEDMFHAWPLYSEACGGSFAAAQEALERIGSFIRADNVDRCVEILFEANDYGTTGIDPHPLDTVDIFAEPAQVTPIWYRNGKRLGKSEWIVPKNVTSTKDRILYLHGGSYSSNYDYHPFLSRLAHESDMAVFSIDYRLVPEFIFPAPVEDAIASVRFLWENGPNGKEPADRVFLNGDSAGAGLVVSTLMAIISGTFNGTTPIPKPAVKLPTAAITISAFTDISCSLPAYYTRIWHPTVRIGDPVFTGHSGDDEQDLNDSRLVGIRYMNSTSTKDLRNPVASPYWAPDEWLMQLPPLLMIVGDAEVSLDDTIEFYKRAVAAGAKHVTYQNYLRMWHVFPLYTTGCGGSIQEAVDANREMGDYVKSFRKSEST
ncbi:Acetyl-hydrolase [Diplonema papillatum]|nr:Acetyl-hydrolase [Diplonema papillatum]